MSAIDIQSFRPAFHGQLFEPVAAGYNEARQIWNASVNKHPILIAQCSGVSDVIAAVNFGRANDLLTAIRGGGHNVGGRALCDGGIVIDLSRMRSVYVDSANSSSTSTQYTAGRSFIKEFAYKAAPLSVISTAKPTSSGLQSRPA